MTRPSQGPASNGPVSHRTPLTIASAAALAVVSMSAAGCRVSAGTSAPRLPLPSPAPPQASVVVADGHGWSAAGLQGPVPAPGTCHYRVANGRYSLPDPSCTPGAVDPAVTEADLASTVCRRGGYTYSVRPPERLTETFKIVDEAAYRDPYTTYHTELDHLIPLELGGSSDTRNLWAEPDQGTPADFDPQDPFGVNAKDGVEDRLHQAVCSGQVGLAAAQDAIAADWTTALARLGVDP